MRKTTLIGGPLGGHDRFVAAADQDWYLIEHCGRIHFYLWDHVSDGYIYDGSITGTRQTAVAVANVLYQRESPLHVMPLQSESA